MANQAAFLPAKQAKLEVRDTPLESPSPNEVLIRNHAVSINPVDIKLQDTGNIIDAYPFIAGFEVAGQIEEVGSAVTRFKKGDRVVGLCAAIRTKKIAHGGFQHFTLCVDPIVAHVPDNISFTNAVVLPLAIATAAAGLYEPMYLGLAAPPAPISGEAGKKAAFLIWGGSSVIGSAAIQLAAASGLTVLTTASKSDFGYVEELGAHHVFDCDDAEAVQKLIDVASSMTVVGAYDMIGTKESCDQCAEFLHHFGGGKLAATGNSQEIGDVLLLGDVQQTVVHAPSPSPGNMPVWLGVYHHFISTGLKDGIFKAKPDPTVIKGGLPKIQEAMDLDRERVSAGKIVVEL